MQTNQNNSNLMKIKDAIYIPILRNNSLSVFIINEDYLEKSVKRVCRITALTETKNRQLYLMN